MQNQALPSIFVHQRQPLERAATGRAVVNEVARPNIVLEPSGLLDATVRAGAWFRAEFPGPSQPHGSLQAQLAPKPVHALEVQRPAVPDQQGMNPTGTEPGVPAGQAVNLPN